MITGSITVKHSQEKKLESGWMSNWYSSVFLPAHHEVWSAAWLPGQHRRHSASLPAGGVELAEVFLGSGHRHNPGWWDGFRQDCADGCLPLLIVQGGKNYHLQISIFSIIFMFKDDFKPVHAKILNIICIFWKFLMQFCPICPPLPIHVSGWVFRCVTHSNSVQ